MAKRRGYSPEQIITKLREVEVLLSQGKTVAQICKAIEANEQTYYPWRKEYGRMTISQAKQLKALEKENAKLKKLVANLSLDNAILKEVLGKINLTRTTRHSLVNSSMILKGIPSLSHNCLLLGRF